MKGCIKFFTTIFMVLAGSVWSQCSIAAIDLKRTDLFLSDQQAVSSLLLLPPPPNYDTTSFLRDESFFHMRQNISEERINTAIADSKYKKLSANFSDAFGIPITPEVTPILYNLLERYKAEARRATQSAKKHYARQRPFVFFHEQTCTPKKEDRLRQTGSYPSAHTTIGWGTMMILSEVRPDRYLQLFKRGYEFGQSRVICGAHWQSDVDAGRLLGSIIVSILHKNSEFIEQIEAAKREVQNVLGSPMKF